VIWASSNRVTEVELVPEPKTYEAKGVAEWCNCKFSTLLRPYPQGPGGWELRRLIAAAAFCNQPLLIAAERRCSQPLRPYVRPAWLPSDAPCPATAIIRRD
jgi:hypothetical protein